jgi:hypothetical protein
MVWDENWCQNLMPKSDRKMTFINAKIGGVKND